MNGGKHRFSTGIWTIKTMLVKLDIRILAASRERDEVNGIDAMKKNTAARTDDDVTDDVIGGVNIGAMRGQKNQTEPVVDLIDAIFDGNASHAGGRSLNT